ncbi:sulfatase-like hydrolase/transferase [Cyclobacterium sp.]|uniref:sulfatase family protein n=1 Tax=Cyclobacterium sp. TaxID=1966343 RepID=UPI0025B89F8F|nr:sulfatase-like hydrolase/transferase [Cyclobacterium sp.]
MKKLITLIFILFVIDYDGFCSVGERPNIIFIFADDWGWGDLSCHGHPYIKTPNIDRLAVEGTDFTRFTVASGVCSPSRAAVVTGQFPARQGIIQHFDKVANNVARGMPDWLSLDAPSLPRFLQEAGYETALYGKWHLSNSPVTDSPRPDAYGYDDYAAFNCSGEEMPWFEDTILANAFIEESIQQDKPFFINLWIHEPHTPHHSLPKYERMFNHLENREDQIYAAVLAHADDRIGQVLNTLDRLGITDQTLVVFSSDNGPERAKSGIELLLMDGHATGAGWNIAASRGITGGRRGFKASVFEGGIGVPFIARWPGKIKAGEIDEVSLISAVDLLPTFCELAGAKLPDDFIPDGVSFTRVLLGDPMLQRKKPLFWKIHPGSRYGSDHWAAFAIVHDKWKLVTNSEHSRFVLYNISQDVTESKDLYAEKPETVAYLLAMLEDWEATLPEAPFGDVFSKLRESDY